MAQELAHNYGRQHVNCGDDPDNVDPNYPYPPCQIANVGADSYYGFDVTTRQPIRPNQTADFMSYANRSWVSDYTWRALINKFCPACTAAADCAGQRRRREQRLRQRPGRHRRRPRRDRHGAGAAQRQPATRHPPGPASAGRTARSIMAAQPQAAYSLRLLDPAGTVLVNQLLTLLEMDDHVGDADSALFSTVFPQPAGQVAKIQLLADATVSDTITPGINPPQCDDPAACRRGADRRAPGHPVDAPATRTRRTSCSSPCSTATTAARPGTRSRPTIPARPPARTR